MEASPGSQHETPLRRASGIALIAFACIDSGAGFARQMICDRPADFYALNGPYAVNYYEDFEVGHRFQRRWDGRSPRPRPQPLPPSIFCTSLRFSTQTTRGILDIRIWWSVRFLSSAPCSACRWRICQSPADRFSARMRCRIHGAVVPGDLLYASSVVISRRPSKSQPGYGVIEWKRPAGQTGEVAVMFRRTNLVRRRSPAVGEKAPPVHERDRDQFYFEDFAIGMEFRHRRGRTLYQGRMRVEPADHEHGSVSLEHRIDEDLS